eukprot:g7387.t1
MGEMSLPQRLAVASLVAALMAACSPSSALAVVDECRARGRFTSVMLGATILLDFVVVIVFNVAEAMAASVLSSHGVEVAVIGETFAQLFISTVAGVFFGFTLSFVVFWRGRRCVARKHRRYVVQQSAKKALLLSCGALVFMASHVCHPWLEPLLVCLVAGTVVVNYTDYGHEFAILVRELADGVYVFFFTLTGAAMDLRSLGASLLAASSLTITRFGALYVGASAGAHWAREPWARKHGSRAWMAFTTKLPGVALPLAKKVQLLYPGWGAAYATLVVAVVVLNQLFGPILLRHLLKRVGEARLSAGRPLEGAKAGAVEIEDAEAGTTNPVSATPTAAQQGGADDGAAARARRDSERTAALAGAPLARAMSMTPELALVLYRGAAMARSRQEEALALGQRMVTAGWDVVALPLREGGSGTAALVRRLRAALGRHRTCSVLVSMASANAEHAAVLHAAAQAWCECGRATVLRVVLATCEGGHAGAGTADADADAADAAAAAADTVAVDWARWLASQEHGRALIDAVDIVAIRPRGAALRLLELAACGFVTSITGARSGDDPGSSCAGGNDDQDGRGVEEDKDDAEDEEENGRHGPGSRGRGLAASDALAAATRRRSRRRSGRRRSTLVIEDEVGGEEARAAPSTAAEP